MPRISIFKISLSNSASNRFYANGRQQMRVNVEVLQLDDDLKKVALSDAEKNSIKIVALSTSLTGNSSMPVGWDSESNGNGYDSGLFTAARSAEAEAEAEHEGSEAMICCDAGETGETGEAEPSQNQLPDGYTRYVRSTKIETQALMARMTLKNGTVLTTNMDTQVENGYYFKSSVELSAITPLAIQPSQLTARTQVLQDQKYGQFNPDIYQTITAFYWTMPAGLQIRSNERDKGHFYGLGVYNSDRKHSRLSRGRAFSPGTYTAYSKHEMGGGCVQPFDYTMDVSVNQIAVSVIYVSGCAWTSGTWSEKVTFTLVDNYGNTHKYKVEPSGTHGSSVSISAG